MSKVYLAGPISGKTYKDAALGWRVAFAEFLDQHQYNEPDNLWIYCASPMRGKEFLKDKTGPIGQTPEEMAGYSNAIASMHGIATRDANDVKTCDAMVVNFIGAERISIGTVLEIGMAYAWRKPVIMVVDDADPHLHGMLYAMVESNGYIVHSLKEAAFLTYHLLTPSV